MNQIKKGFSLVELMVVILIIGVLAAIAVPQYTRTIEQGRRAEGVVNLDNIRKSELRYHQLYGTYTTDSSALDIDWPAPHYFSYVVNLADASQFTCRATRTDTERPAAIAVYTLQINQNGTVTEN